MVIRLKVRAHPLSRQVVVGILSSTMQCTPGLILNAQAIQQALPCNRSSVYQPGRHKSGSIICVAHQ